MKINIPHLLRTEPTYVTDVDDDDPRPLRTAVERAVAARANLTGADLTGAYLTGADLTDADLGGIRSDFRSVLDSAPNEVTGLLVALRAGAIDGSTYTGTCSCLVGTIARVLGCDYTEITGLEPDSSRPAEKWFLAIQPGATPDNHQVAAITEGWILEWQAERMAVTQ
jgi:hypothetical protein